MSTDRRAHLRALLNKLRYSQPFNRLATTSARALARAAGFGTETLARHLHRVDEVRCLLPNGRTLLLSGHADDWVSNRLFWFGFEGYEPETTALFFRAASSARTVLDVGAYVGYFSLLAAHANAQTRILAFEPFPPSHTRLCSNIALNRLSTIETFNVAVGSAPGHADLFVPQDLSLGLPCSISLSEEFMTQAGVPLRRVSVEVVALDALLDARSVRGVDLVKIDTEGTEHDVLRGLSHTIERDRPAVFLEILSSTDPAPLEAFARKVEYESFHLTPAGPIRRDRIEGHPEWFNYLLLPAGPSRFREQLLSRPTP